MLAESPPVIERQKLAREYVRLLRRLSIVELLVIAALLLMLVFGGISAQLSRLLAFRASLTPLAYDGLADVTALPLLILLLAVSSLAITPLVNAYSRYLEKAAGG